MFIPAWLLIIVVFVGFIFLTPYRQGLIDIFGAIWNVTCGIFVRLRDFLSGSAPAAGAAGTVIGRIIAVFLLLLLAIILFTLFLYVIVGGGIMAVGIATGHWLAALLFLMSLLTWGMLSAIPMISIFRPLNWISRWIARPFAFVLALYILVVVGWHAFGYFSPRLQGSISRSASNNTEEFVNKLDKGSIDSEPEQGIFGMAIKNSTTYNSAGQPIYVDELKKGMLVKVCNLNGKPATANSEGLICVMLPNRFGDYVKGDIRWVPSRKINWDWKTCKSSPKTERGKLVFTAIPFKDGSPINFGGADLPPGKYYVKFPQGTCGTPCYYLNDNSGVCRGLKQDKEGKFIELERGQQLWAFRTKKIARFYLAHLQ
jgi:hypothetical protein